MSSWQNLFLGPYAVFSTAVPKLPVDDSGEPLGWRSFYCHLSGKAYYMPRGQAGQKPKLAPRKMYYGGDPGWPWEDNLVDVKPNDEIAWLKRVYADELAEISTALNTKPEFGWGLLAWY